jgi:hypothetical protein
MTTGLEALRDLILGDPALSETLDAIDDQDVFAARAAQAAAVAGLAVETAEIRAAIQTASIPPARRAFASPGWLPSEVCDLDGRPVVSWRWFGRRRLAEPFYGDDLMRAGYRPLNRLVGLRTPLPGPNDHPPRVPRGLVFHMSRCGSTLAAQMLAASPANVVLSEAAPINAIVRHADLDDEAKVALLRAMVAALGQARNGETRLFLKLDCWHSLDLPLFRRAFPDTPWVFLYRDPVEVLVSQTRRRGVQMVPSLVPPSTFGIDLPDGVPDDDYCARVLAAVCGGAARHYPAGGGRLVNYRQLPEALFTEVLPHFGVTPSEAEAQAMRAATVRDAKTPEQAFAADAQDKQQAATPALREICERRLADVYGQLEALRAGRA